MMIIVKASVIIGLAWLALAVGARRNLCAITHLIASQRSILRDLRCSPPWRINSD
jgi:hypothetical protein